MSAYASSTAAPTREQTRRRLPAAQRRALILEAALRTFAAHGYDRAAMDEIAAGAGISKAVVYDHVASKRQLYTLLLESIRQDLERTVVEAIRVEANGVHAAVEAVYCYVEEHPDASRLLLLELQGANETPLGRELEERIAGGLAHAFAADPGLLRDEPERGRRLLMLAELLKSAVLGLVGWSFRNPGTPRADLVEQTLAVVGPALEHARAGMPARR